MQIHHYCRVLQYIAQVLEFEYFHFTFTPYICTIYSLQWKKKSTNVIQIDSLITSIVAVYLNIAFFSNKQHNFAQLLQNEQPMHCFINGNRNKLFLLFAYAWACFYDIDFSKGVESVLLPSIQTFT